MFLLLGFETKGRSIEEINRALDTPAGPALDPVRVPARSTALSQPSIRNISAA